MSTALILLASPVIVEAVRKHLQSEDRPSPVVVEIVGCVRQNRTKDGWQGRARCDNVDFDFAVFNWDGTSPIDTKHFYEVAWATWPPPPPDAPTSRGKRHRL